MADAYQTTAQVAYFNKVDMELMVSDVLNESPLVQAMAARSTRSNSFVYTRQTAAPSVGVRSANDGIENTVGTYESVTANLKIFDASFGMDIAVAQSDERGVDHAIGVEAVTHLQQSMFEIEQQVLNGTTGNLAGGFDGFADQSNLDGASDSMVVNAGGTTASTGSSVYLIRMGEGDVQLLWGQDGEISIGDRQIVERAGSSTGRFPAFYHPIVSWCGLKIGSTYSVSRIANLTEDSGKGLTDALVYDALSKFPASRQPNVIVMNRRSLEQLRSSRTATNATGAPAPRPAEVDGYPIIVTDAIGNTETLLT